MWELAYPVVGDASRVPRALQSYCYIGIAWVMHASSDLPHHVWGDQIWPFMRTRHLDASCWTRWSPYGSSPARQPWSGLRASISSRDHHRPTQTRSLTTRGLW